MLNFKKGGLFSRKDEPEPDVQQESGAQVLAVWGSGIIISDMAGISHLQMVAIVLE